MLEAGSVRGKNAINIMMKVAVVEVAFSYLMRHGLERA
jgi:hypothetical protein